MTRDVPLSLDFFILGPHSSLHPHLTARIFPYPAREHSGKNQKPEYSKIHLQAPEALRKNRRVMGKIAYWGRELAWVWRRTRRLILNEAARWLSLDPNVVRLVG